MHTRAGRLLPIVAAGLSFGLLSGEPRAAVIDCPLSSTPQAQTTNTLKGFADTTNGGVVYDTTTANLHLKKEAGVFSSNFFAATGNPQYACSADFNGDGWIDFVGADANGMQLGYYRNDTASNVGASPNWTNPAFVVTPKFTLTPAATYFWTQATNMGGGGVTACGDFNKDGYADFAMVLETNNDGGNATLAKIWKGNGNGTFAAPYNINASFATDFTGIMWDGNMVAADYDNDTWLDLIFPAADAGGGYVRVFHNNGGTSPTFTASTYLKQNLGMGTNGVNGVVYKDLNNDGVRDLAVVGKDSSTIKLYPGVLAGGFGTLQSIVGHSGGALLVAEDFSLDGMPDLVLGTDGNTGVVKYYKNDGDSAPFSGGVTQTLVEAFSDFDTGFAFNYDNDPDGTQDFMFADGNGAGYAVFANRTLGTYVPCGDVVSGTLDLGALSSTEMVVTAARISSATLSVPAGTSLTFYLSNENPESWWPTYACGSDYCVNFPHPVGRYVKWKARMCTDQPNKTKTPVITGLSLGFDYRVALEHYRSGVVVFDGVAYIGAFSQPGDRGHFYAINAGLSTTYWDAATKLNAMTDSSRNIYTVAGNNTTRLDFTTANASSTTLQTALAGATLAQAQSVIAWIRTARFGVSGQPVAQTKLGAIETSTPAVVSAPALPTWYFHAPSAVRAKVDAFVSAHADRKNLVIFGSKDGAFHAVRTLPTSITDPSNGEEAWAFIPGHVASRMRTDQAASVAAGDTTITAYPDGSPTVADVVFADGEVHTVALFGSGNGGKAINALDITETINENTNAVVGPTSLWQYTPGTSEAGLATTKPVIARVLINGAARFIAIVATGIDSISTNGRHVVALDVQTGAPLWQFQAACAVTSDLLVFETDDTGEPGGPLVDGYVDRLVFADRCGNVYKLNPAAELPLVAGAPGWLSSAGMGGINTGITDGTGAVVYALFSTTSTTNAIGSQRPITGTIGAHTDNTNRMALFFGTGGLESYAPGNANAFFAVYADTGVVRSKLDGTCSGGKCEKFYGGVVVTATSVISTRSVDPVVGTGACDPGSATLEVSSINPNPNGTNTFVSTYVQTMTSAVQGSLYGDGNALYFATLAGRIGRIGTPRATSAGGDTASGYLATAHYGQAEAAGQGTTEPMTLLGWRQVY